MSTPVSGHRGNPALDKQVDGLNQNLVFHAPDAGGQGFGSIVGGDRDFALKDDRPMVVQFIDEMHRSAAFFGAGGQNLFVNAHTVHPGAAEARQECRVNVDDPTAITVNDFSGHLLHIPGQNYQFDLVIAEELCQLLDKFFPRLATHIGQMNCLNVVLPSPGQRTRLAIVGEDELNPGGQPSRFDGVDHGLEVGTFSRSKDSQIQNLHRRLKRSKGKDKVFTVPVYF